MDKKKDRVMNDVKDFMKNVRKIIHVEKFILFGSRARGNSKARSDIDLIIISKDFEGIKFFKRSPALYLLWDSSYDIDIICLTPKEFALKIKEIGIMRQAAAEGVEL